ncbi:MAG: hypothetical protein K6L76_08420 [Agarilytica sp.]
MPFKLRFIPNLCALCFGGLIASLLVAFILIPETQRTHQASLSHYGRALAEMAAKQAVDATFNHDLVRLQVILQDVISNPHAELATIHDVENNLLVQAGDSRKRIKPAAAFTSPIILHDSVAGYLSVTLHTQLWSLGSSVYFVIALAGLFLVAALWSLFHSGAVSWLARDIKPETHTETDEEALSNNAETDSDEITEGGDTTLEENRKEVYAVIHIKNLNVLKQQLNGQSYRDTLARLEKISADVLALYSGHSFELIDNYYLFKFYERDNRGEALFNAACSAYLIMELSGIINKIPLDLAALVSADEGQIEPEKLPFAGLIVEASAGAEDLIHRRIEFMELGTEDGRQVLSGFKQPFQSLLEKQHQQLCQIL